MNINTLRTELTNQGWEVTSFNSREGRYYYAQHAGLKRSIEGSLETFRVQAAEALWLK